MNRYRLIFTLVLLTAIGNISFAQSKEEEKEWAKKLKELKPMDYKKLVQRNDSLMAEFDNCLKAQNSQKSEIEAKDAEIAKLKKELEDYSSGSVPGVAQKTEVKQEKEEIRTERQETKGLVYKVQIGSFKSKDLTKYFDNNPNFSGEIDSDGTKKYTLGVFTDYWEADKFKSALRDMGVKGAWIVAYKDGHRVEMKDAREGVL